MKTLNLISKVDDILLRKKISREWLAKQLGCSKQNMVSVLKIGDPKLSFCLRLAKELDTTVFELFELDNTYAKKTNKTTINEPNEQYEVQNPILKRLDKIIKILENKENIKK